MIVKSVTLLKSGVCNKLMLNSLTYVGLGRPMYFTCKANPVRKLQEPAKINIYSNSAKALKVS